MFGSFAFEPAFIFTLAGSVAWLVIRERSGLSFLFLLVTVVIPLVLFAIRFRGAAASISAPVGNVLATIIGVGIAWAAWAVYRNRRAALT